MYKFPLYISDGVIFSLVSDFSSRDFTEFGALTDNGFTDWGLTDKGFRLEWGANPHFFSSEVTKKNLSAHFSAE